MKTITIHLLDTLDRVNQWLAKRPGLFPPDTLATSLVTDLAQETIQLRKAAADQSAAAAERAGVTLRKGLVLDALHDDLGHVNRAAKALDAERPGVHKQFRMPRRYGEARLQAAAEGFAEDAAEIEADLVRCGMAAGTLATIQTRLETIETLVQEQDNALAQQVRNTAKLEETSRQARRSLSRIKAILRSQFASDPTTLREWNSVSRIERARPQEKEEKPQVEVSQAEVQA